MGNWVSVVGIAITALAGLFATWYTQRTARRNASEASAVTGFLALTQEQRTEILRLFQRVADLEADKSRRDREEVTRRRLAHAHDRWDQLAADRIRELSQDPFPNPPPLDIWSQSDAQSPGV